MAQRFISSFLVFIFSIARGPFPILASETLRPQSGSPIVQSGMEERLRGTPVSHREAGVTEQQYLAELRVYLDRLETESLPAEGAGPLSQEGVRHVVFFYPYTLYAGGAPTFQRNILETLLKTHRNLNLDLVYLNFDEAPSMRQLKDPLRNNQITLHGIPNMSPGGAEVTKPVLAERLKQVIHKIHGESPIDLIVNNNSTHLYEMSRGLLEFAHGHGIATHLYFHGGLITEGLRYLMQHSDGVATNSSAFGQIFSQLGVNAEVLPPLSDLSFFWSPLTDSDRAAMDQWIEQYGFKGKKVIVHPARLYPLKGQEDVILAAEVLRNRYPQLAKQIAWVMMGPPRDVGEGERLRRLAQQKGIDVLFVGMQTREEIRRWYHLAYAVVYPTRGDEPFGLVAAEAQAAGTPVVVTNVGGLPETLAEGQTGLVVGRQDPEHLAEAIAYLVADPARRHQMAQAAYRYTQERYPPQKTLAGFTDSYLRAVRSKKEGKRNSGPLANPPLDPGRVLFDLYNPHRDPGWRRGRGDVSKADQWRRAWLAKILQAQPHWKPSPQLPFDYSEEATPAYDPNRIPARPLGPFQRLRMPENPNRSGKSITRKDSLLHTGESNLLDRWESRFLLDDPFSDELVVTANRYPKVIYDSLLLSRQWQPQRLTPQAIHSQIEWARRGVVSEFHHTDVFVDHLHLHLLVSDTAPAARFSGSFVPEDQWGGVAVGGIGYPVRHIALASSDFNALKNATFLLAEQLEEEDRPFSQTVLPAPQGDSVIVLFHVWKDFPKSFSFSPAGFVKVVQEEVPDSHILEEMDRIFLSAKDLRQLRASFWDRWKSKTDTEAKTQAGAEEPPPHSLDGVLHALEVPLGGGGFLEGPFPNIKERLRVLKAIHDWVSSRPIPLVVEDQAGVLIEALKSNLSYTHLYDTSKEYKDYERWGYEYPSEEDTVSTKLIRAAARSALAAFALQERFHNLLGLTPQDFLLPEGISWFEVRNFLQSFRRKDRSLERLRYVLTLHPEWVTKRPSRRVVRRFAQAVSWLPPTGGKIPVVLDARGVGSSFWAFLRTLPPSWTAEEQTEEILRWRREGELGSGYVHQLTVQGRLPDEFKYVALGLILASPYRNDWTEPFFEAHWGKVAPLVHDGGIVTVDLNPLWKKVEGRTDFLQRVAKVYLKDLEVLESLPEAEQIKRRKDLQPAESEAYERTRLTLEARAYQRLALALHAKLGTAPKEIPEDIQEKLKQHWVDFEGKMRALLGEFGLKGAAEVTWFTEEARPLAGWDRPRHEAPWEPIQRELIHLEEIRKEYPQPLFNRANQILQEMTDAIDHDLGLLAAGAEEGTPVTAQMAAGIVRGWAGVEPGQREAVVKSLAEHGYTLEKHRRHSDLILKGEQEGPASFQAFPPAVDGKPGSADYQRLIQAGSDPRFLGREGVIVAAAGEGTRLLENAVKAGLLPPDVLERYTKPTVPVTPVRGQSPLGYQLETYADEAATRGVPLPVRVVLHPEVGTKVAEMIHKNNNFGLAHLELVFQGMNPILDSQGMIVLRDDGTVSFNPDGTGGVVGVALQNGGEGWFASILGPEAHLAIINGDMLLKPELVELVAGAATEHPVVGIGYGYPPEKDVTGAHKTKLGTFVTLEQGGRTQAKIVEYRERGTVEGLPAAVTAAETQGVVLQANSGLYGFPLKGLAERVRNLPPHHQKDKDAIGVSSGKVQKVEAFASDIPAKYDAGAVGVLSVDQAILTPIKDADALRQVRTLAVERERQQAERMGIALNPEARAEFHPAMNRPGRVAVGKNVRVEGAVGVYVHPGGVALYTRFQPDKPWEPFDPSSKAELFQTQPGQPVVIPDGTVFSPEGVKASAGAEEPTEREIAEVIETLNTLAVHKEIKEGQTPSVFYQVEKWLRGPFPLPDVLFRQTEFSLAMALERVGSAQDYLEWIGLDYHQVVDFTKSVHETVQDLLAALEAHRRINEMLTPSNLAQVSVAHLNHKNRYVRTSAWKTFFTLAADERSREMLSSVIPTVNDFLLDPDLEVRQAAQQALAIFLSPAISLLPPVGGKILVVLDARGVVSSRGETLPPSWTAEEQAEEILRWRREGELGSGYVHQLTVQGRLPDEFKYAALALILASPYKNDWTQPFFEAHWGKVAPLVHDGGNVTVGLNPLWKNVEGRTDFLQRVAKVYLKDLEVLESLPEAEQIKRRKDLGPAESEVYERARLMLEARAYQRLALALHAKLGTAPKEIPPDLQEKLKQHWVNFEGKMRSLLGEFGLQEAAEVTWFTEEARLLAGWNEPRQEAPWEPIQRELIHLEQVREEYPQPLFNRANQILQEMTDAIDRDLGLLSAGAEEPIFDSEAARRMGLDAQVLREQGTRPTQQDDYALVSFGRPGEEPAGVLAIVTDGMGGRPDGDKASRTAVTRIPEILNQPPAPGGTAFADLLKSFRQAEGGWRLSLQGQIQDRLREALVQTSREIKRGGTTAVLALVAGETAFIAWAGDSRVYGMSGGKLELLTEDHTGAWFFEKRELVSPVLPADQLNLAVSKQVRAKNLLNSPMLSFLGAEVGEEPFVEQKVVQMKPGDRLALMSDGIVKPADDRAISLGLQRAPTASIAAASLMKRAKAGHDNRTVLILEAQPKPETAPAVGTSAPSPVSRTVTGGAPAVPAGETPVTKLVRDWGLNKLEELRIVAVTAQVAQAHRELAVLGEGAVQMGSAWLIILPKEQKPEQIAGLLDLIATDVSGKTLSVWEYYVGEKDPSLRIFDALVRSLPLNPQVTELSADGMALRDLLRQIIANLRGMKPEAVSEEDLQVLEAALPSFV